MTNSMQLRLAEQFVIISLLFDILQMDEGYLIEENEHGFDRNIHTLSYLLRKELIVEYFDGQDRRYAITDGGKIYLQRVVDVAIPEKITQVIWK
jgi:predicted transcriptional regulator